MERLEYLPRGLALLVRPNGHGRAVAVGTGDHQDMIALQTMVAGVDVGR